MRHHKGKSFRFRKELPGWEAKKKAGEIRGFDHEKRALAIAKKQLKEKFRKIKYSVDPCSRDYLGRKLKGKDLEFTILSPLILKWLLKSLLGTNKIYIEVKSSRRGAREHRSKGKMQLIYRAGVVIVNKRRTDEKIVLSMYEMIKCSIRNLLRERWFLKNFSKKLQKTILIWLSS
jgi:hypothetical protein